jgi:hypothetical protein
MMSKIIVYVFVILGLLASTAAAGEFDRMANDRRMQMDMDRMRVNQEAQVRQQQMENDRLRFEQHKIENEMRYQQEQRMYQQQRQY